MRAFEEQDERMCFEFYSHLDPKPHLNRKLVLVITEADEEEEAESSEGQDNPREELLCCRFESSDFMQTFSDGIHVGMEIEFLKKDLPLLFNSAREEIDRFIEVERQELGLDLEDDLKN